MHRRVRPVAAAAVLTCLILGLGLILSGNAPALASQQGTPTPAPPGTRDVPQPQECLVTPRPLDSFLALVQEASAVASPVAAASPTAFAPPAGSPADDATVTAITLATREVLACLNAGDQLRYYGLLTDEAIRRELARFGPPPQRYLDRLREAPVPGRGPFQTIALIRVTGVTTLADGRVGAYVVQEDGADPRPREVIYVVFTQGSDRWLVDEIFYEVPPPAAA